MIRHAPRTRESGIGLVELMITLTLTAAVLAFLYSSFFRTQHKASNVMRQVDARQGVRAAVQILERDLRMSGSGWGRIQVDGIHSGTPLVLRGLNPGYGSSGQSDSISVIGGWDVNTTLRDSMPNPSATIRCVSTAGFSVNDLVVVTNGASAHLFQVTGVQASPADLAHATSSPYNTTGTLANWPAGGGGYGTGARVFKVGWITYRVDSTSYRRPAVVRQEFGKAAQLVALDVESFQIWYRMADGTSTRNPINLPMIDQVVPMVRTLTLQPGSAPVQDSIWAAIRPRTF
jgi:hypothetical protein